MKQIEISGERLTLDEVWQAARAEPLTDARSEVEVVIASDAWARVRSSQALVERLAQGKAPVYGVNTGFGKLAEVAIPPEQTAELQRNLIRSHACAVGEELSVEATRAVMLLRANALAKGYSGIREQTLRLLVDCLNCGVHPVIPQQGSLGASGDLAPLAHVALTLMGEGRARYRGERLSSAEALSRAGLQPVELAAKEGLALINGTQVMTAIAALAFARADHLAWLADGIAAMTMEALRGIVDAFDEALHALRPHAGQVSAATAMRHWLSGSRLTTRQGELRVQDAYSLRCVPQVHGATRQALGYVLQVLETEINSATDNPLVFVDSERVLSGGHFHGQPVALAMDFMKIAVAELANVSERRIERMVNPSLSGLSPFLTRKPGLSSGLMIAQYVAASLVSENKVLAHPASVDSIPSSAGQEDHVSMGTTAARHAAVIVENAARALAIEAVVAVEAIDLQGMPDQMAPRTRQLYEQIRALVPPVKEDRSLSEDFERVAELFLDRGPTLAAAVRMSVAR